MLIILAIAAYWIGKSTGPAQARRDIAQANALTASPQTPPPAGLGQSLEDAAQAAARTSRQGGLPRQVSNAIALVSVDAIGAQVAATYEFTAPAMIPVTNEILSEMRDEIRQNFRSSTTCTVRGARALLDRGLTFVQRYNLYRSKRSILVIKLGAADCEPRR